MKYALNDIIDVLSEYTQDYIEYTNKDLFIEAVSPLVIPISVIGGIIAKNIYDIKHTIKEEERKKIELKKKDKEEIDTFISNMNSKKHIFTLDNKNLKIDTVDDVFKYVESDVKNIIGYIKKDSKYKQKIKDSIDDSINKFKNNMEKYKFNEEDLDSYKESLETYEFVCNPNQTNNELTIEVIDGEQDARIAVGFILDDIERVLKEKYKNVFNEFNLKLSTGDGDEGCVYLEKIKKKK